MDRKPKFVLALLVAASVAFTANYAGEITRATDEEVEELMAAFRQDEILANFLFVFKAQARARMPDISDAAFAKFIGNCTIDGPMNNQVDVYSNAFDRDQILDLTSAFKSTGGQRYVASVLEASAKGLESFESDQEFSFLDDPEVQEFLKQPIVDEWASQAWDLAAKAEEKGVTWAEECVDHSALEDPQP